jgi:hypothetical protein
MVYHDNIRRFSRCSKTYFSCGTGAHMCENQTLSMLAEGDFNTIRSPQEKNNNSYNAHWPFIFTAIIGSLNLREIILSGRQCTLARRRKTRTYEKLDRVLASVDWEQKYSLVSFRALSRSVFDHIPLLIDYGEQAIRLSFVLNYLGFGRMVFMIWVWENGMHLFLEIVPLERSRTKLDTCDVSCGDGLRTVVGL